MPSWGFGSTVQKDRRKQGGGMENQNLLAQKPMGDPERMVNFAPDCHFPRDSSMATFISTDVRVSHYRKDQS
jgi:hypothetical protein